MFPDTIKGISTIFEKTLIKILSFPNSRNMTFTVLKKTNGRCFRECNRIAPPPTPKTDSKLFLIEKGSYFSVKLIKQDIFKSKCNC